MSSNIVGSKQKDKCSLFHCQGPRLVRWEQSTYPFGSHEVTGPQVTPNYRVGRAGRGGQGALSTRLNHSSLPSQPLSLKEWNGEKREQKQKGAQKLIGDNGARACVCVCVCVCV